MTVLLDGLEMGDRKSAHDHLKVKLHLPDYYGRNLDALYDLLTERGEPLTIMVQNQAEIYTEALLDTLKDAADNNPNLEIVIE